MAVRIGLSRIIASKRGREVLNAHLISQSRVNKRVIALSGFANKESVPIALETKQKDRHQHTVSPCHVLHGSNGNRNVRNQLLCVPLELVALGMPLNAVERIVFGLNGGSKRFAFAVHIGR